MQKVLKLLDNLADTCHNNPAGAHRIKNGQIRRRPKGQPKPHRELVTLEYRANSKPGRLEDRLINFIDNTRR